MKLRLVRILAGLLAGLAWSTSGFAGEPDPGACDLDFNVAAWRVASLLGDASGTAVWVRCPDGTWRLDLARAEPGEPDTGTQDAALARLGEGWTVAAPGDGTVVLQAWDGPLRTLDQDQARRMTALLSLADVHGAPDRAEVAPAVWRVGSDRRERVGRTPWEIRPAGPLRTSLIWPPSGAGDSPLARDLASRGLGRGGAGESWRVDTTAVGGVRIRSRRLASTLELGAPLRSVRRGDPFEVVLPLWPLGEVLTGDAIR